MFTHRIIIKHAHIYSAVCSHAHLTHVHTHQHSPESSNISSIKTQWSLHAAAPLAGGREINRQLSGDAMHYVTRPAVRKQLTGRGRRVQT